MSRITYIGKKTKTKMGAFKFTDENYRSINNFSKTTSLSLKDKIGNINVFEQNCQYCWRSVKVEFGKTEINVNLLSDRKLHHGKKKNMAIHFKATI